MRDWDIDFYFNPDCIITIPLWATFPGLPVGYWFCEALRKLTSAMGLPKHTNQITERMVSISNALVVVEKDISQL